MMVLGLTQTIDEAGPGRIGAGGVRGAVRRCVAAAIVLLGTGSAMPAGASAAHDPQVFASVPLPPLGYQTVSQEFLLAGNSMLTVHFVDAGHLLITFNVRRLMKREPGDPPEDDDRVIAARLVELPSGKVVAQTEWRAHDRGTYLWGLGHGHFLLRVRDKLTTFAPLEATAPGDAFQETPFLQTDRHIVAVLVSADADLLTLETTRQPSAVVLGSDPAPVQISFYRLNSGEPGASGRLAQAAGVIRTRSALALPMTTGGFLEVLEGGKDRWMFNFDEHAGKIRELAEWDTSCFPHPVFVGHGEFIAFGCRGSADKVDLAGFNLKGEEMWEQGLFDVYVSPTYSFAPAAGRFALGRTLVSTGLDADVPLSAGIVTGQEVRVYQSYNGKILFKTDCSPVERAGQNFALSDDGLRLAVVHETMMRHAATKDYDAYVDREPVVDVYALPALTDVDRAAVRDAQATAPADSGARVDQVLMRISAAAKGTGGAAQEAEQSAPMAASAATPGVGSGTGADGGGVPVTASDSAPAGATSTAAQGDAEPSAPRTPPTLYGPDEKQPKKQPQ